MADAIQSPAQATFWFIQGRVLFWIINLVGTACLAYIVARRMAPLVRGQRDIRFDRPLIRLGRLLQFCLGSGGIRATSPRGSFTFSFLPALLSW